MKTLLLFSTVLLIAPVGDTSAEDARLEFRVQFYSPTGLFPKQEISCAVKQRDLPAARSQIDKGLMEVVNKLPGTSTRRGGYPLDQGEFLAV